MKILPNTIPEILAALKSVPDSFILPPSSRSSISRWEKKHGRPISTEYREWLGLAGACTFRCKLVLMGAAGTRDYPGSILPNDAYPFGIEIGSVSKHLSRLVSLVDQPNGRTIVVADDGQYPAERCYVIASSFTSLLRLVLAAEYKPRMKIFTEREAMCSIDPGIVNVSGFPMGWEFKGK